jgi:hypothetical protein
MNGFSSAWLHLREPADHRARNRKLLAALGRVFADRRHVNVIDLGCGTGSNLRALASHLPHRQCWRLIDHDPALLAAGHARLLDWADRAEMSDRNVVLTKGGRELTTTLAEGDLGAGVDEALGSESDLVTAAALFDLVSAHWIARFASAVAARRAVFYAALVYDGVQTWHPPDPRDEAVLAAFHAHQAGDKGFGSAAGPGAANALAEAFSAAGYEVSTGASPWRLGAEQKHLVRALARHVAAAVRETGRMPDGDVIAWRAARENAASCTIGHADLLALPPARRYPT